MRTTRRTARRRLATASALAVACALGGCKRDDGRGRVRDEVTRWDRQWTAARRCLLGEPARAADPVHALALGALDAAPAALTACADTVEAAAPAAPSAAAPARPGDEATAAWGRIAREIVALRDLLSGAPAAAADAWLGELGAAVARLDAARDELRAAAGLGPAARAAAMAPVALPAPTPLVVDGRRLDADSARRLAGGTIAGEIVHDGWAFALTGPDTGWSVQWDDYAVLAVPDRSWMARRCKGTDIDPDADELSTALIAAATGVEVDHERCVPVLPPGDEWPRPLAALGAGAERSIVIVREQLDPSRQTLYDLVVSTDGGQRWTLRPGPPQLTSHSLADAHADRVAGTVDLLFRTRDERGIHHVLLQLDGARPLEVPPPIETEELVLEGACRAGGTTWWLGAGGVHRARGGALTTLAVPGGAATGHVVDCTADAALVAPGDPVEAGLLGVAAAAPGSLHVCTAGGACAPAPGAPPRVIDHAALLPDGRVAYVASRGPVIALWTGAAAPTYFALPRDAAVHGLVVWDGAPWAIVVDSTAGAPARQPLSAVRLAAP